MKFKVFEAKAYYYDQKEIEALEELGFEFNNGRRKGGQWDSKASVEINNMEELMAFIEKYGQIIVDDESIIIYNDYIE